MIVIKEELLANAAKAVADCLRGAHNTRGVNLKLEVDDARIRREVLALIACRAPADYAIGAMIERTQFVDIQEDGTWVSWPPLRERLA